MMAFVLSIGPLSRLSSVFLSLYKYRRHLGVSIFFLGALHATQVISFHELDIYNLISEGSFAALGVITLGGLFFLSLTSWDFIDWHFISWISNFFIASTTLKSLFMDGYHGLWALYMLRPVQCLVF